MPHDAEAERALGLVSGQTGRCIQDGFQIITLRKLTIFGGNAAGNLFELLAARQVVLQDHEELLQLDGNVDDRGKHDDEASSLLTRDDLLGECLNNLRALHEAVEVREHEDGGAFRAGQGIDRPDGRQRIVATGLSRLVGARDLDWARLHKRDIADIEYSVAQLKTDRFRHKWWLKEPAPAVVRHARRKGPQGIKEAVRSRVFQSVGRVYHMDNGKVQPFRDGAQTPTKKARTIIHYGQHATATCCRKCIEIWYGITRGRELTEQEVDYVVELLLTYIRTKLPELGEE